ncbi:preprotein translocase subunit SecE [candidate division WWE3 bacterium]|nr:preprotein translocase subunit SecE [candidate division WWE3 bacterium]
MKALIKFLKDSKREFTKVDWPSKKETLRLTGYVIGVSFSIALFVMGIDYVFKSGLEVLLGF